MYSSPSLRTDLANTRKNLGAFLPAIYLILFQLWSLLQFSLLSVDKTASLNQSMIGMGFTLLLTLWFFNIRLNKAMTALYACIVTFTTIQAGYGIWVFLSEANLLLWMPKLHYLDRPTGFFVNSNHFASYVVLAIIVCLSHSLAKAHRQHHQNIFATLSDAIYSPKLIILGFLLITLILTKSIGALVALSVVFSIMTLNVIRKSRHKKSISFGLASLVLIAIAILLTLDYSIIEDEISGFEHTFLRRVELSKAGFAMLKNNWLFGIGGGSFYSQFSQYRTLEIGNTYYNYAHNDFLQFWIEYGLLGVSLLTLFIITIVRDNLRVLADRTTTMKKTFAYASLYSIISVAIHSLVDFPLHMPGFAALFLVIISINSLSFMHEALFFDVHEQQS
ncbi:O-antigen ligase family protein [Arenicella xantha]|uniref:O-antigen ligase-like membrane protein n=1 Tax=Arenicella xantha TaxID=644221 RepID=A0A395JTN7_9GAMM|nr:O-antigen ligase family protein [Arenicella xantha]RBP52948.1 O-antigen ligase-like membrane protein [Arenicella xantha]